MKSHDPAPLTPKQQRAALLLAGGKSVRETAEEVGAGLRTLYDWQSDERFRRLVRSHRDRMISEATALLSEGAAKAVNVLRDLLASSDESVKLRSASALLDRLVRIREHSEIAERLDELERRLGETTGEGPRL